MYSSRSTEIPHGKYNRWCERRPLVCNDEARLYRSDAYVGRNDLTYSEKSAFYLHELVGCMGLEFVVFSNIRLDEPIELPRHIKIVPCFIPNIGRNMCHPLAQITIQMASQSRFIYDGWLPINDWEVEAVREAVRSIDAALSVFALRCSAWFSWEPKYSGISRQEPYYEFSSLHVQEVSQLSQCVDSLNRADAGALLRSIAWLAQSVRITEPSARFLFGVLAIESLVTYIEEESTDDSALRRLSCTRLSRAERSAERCQCIQEIIHDLLPADPEGAIRSAYFDCLVGIRRRLRSHLEAIFATDQEAVNLLFDTTVDGKALYDLRSDIAHGRIDALSEAQREEVYSKVSNIERIARKYILRVFELIIGAPALFTDIGGAITVSYQGPLLTGIISDESMYNGPTHMAEVYAIR